MVVEADGGHPDECHPAAAVQYCSAPATRGAQCETSPVAPASATYRALRRPSALAAPIAADADWRGCLSAAAPRGPRPPRVRTAPGGPPAAHPPDLSRPTKPLPPGPRPWSSDGPTTGRHVSRGARARSRGYARSMPSLGFGAPPPVGPPHGGSRARQTNGQRTFPPPPGTFLRSDRHGTSNIGHPLLQRFPLAVRCVDGRRSTQGDSGPPAATTPCLPQGHLRVRQLAGSGRGRRPSASAWTGAQRRVRRGGEAGDGHHAMRSLPL